MGVKKWPGPLNRVIKCRYFKQQSELECASELYLHGGDTGFKTHVEIPWPIVSSPIYYAVSPPLNGGERNNERGVVHDMTFKRRIFSFLFFFFSFFCRPRKWVERVESSWGIWCFHRGYISYAWYILKVHFLRTHLRNDLSSNKIGGSISGEVVNCSINCSFLSTLLNNSFVKLLIVSILFLYIYIWNLQNIYGYISFSKRNYNNEMMSNSKNEESFAT